MNENKINAAVAHAIRAAIAAGNPAVIAATVAVAAAVAGRNRTPVDFARDRAAADRVASIRRTATSTTPAPEARRPAHESAAFLVNAIDNGHEEAERLASYCDHAAAGVRFADRVDARPLYLAMRDDGTETWRVVVDADDVTVPVPAAPPVAAWKPRTVIRRAAR